MSHPKNFSPPPDSEEDDEYEYDPWSEEEWQNDYDWERELFEGLLERIRNGTEPITPELISSIDDEDRKREVIEAICLRRANKL